MWLFLFKSMTYLFMVGILGEFTSIGILKKKNNNPLKKGEKSPCIYFMSALMYSVWCFNSLAKYEEPLSDASHIFGGDDPLKVSYTLLVI